MRNRRVDVHRLLGDAPPLIGAQKFERAHVVQTIGQLHQHHADVVDHRQQHLPHIFGLLLFARELTDVRNLGETFDQVRHLFTKIVADGVGIGQRVFDHVVK